MTDDLVGRLRRDSLKYQTNTFEEAAARIEALEGEKAGLLGRINAMADDLVLMGMARDRYAAVLRPFAEAAERIRADEPSNDRPALARVIEYRAAAAALTPEAPHAD